MAWANVTSDPSVGRDARETGVHHYRNLDNYAGHAFGMNQPGNWKSGWSPTGQMSQRPYKPNWDSEYQRYLDVKINQPMYLWEKGGGADWMPKGKFTNIPSQRGWKEDEIEGPNIPPGGIMDSSFMQDLQRAPGNAWSDLKNMFGGFKLPSFMMADSIVKNQAQHKDLDQYFQSQDPENWRNAKNASFFQKQGFMPGLDWRSLSNRNDPNRDISGLSGHGKQAMTKFNLAGITDQVMAKFMDPTYKFGGNEAWLRSQAGDKDLFDEGMSLIKNAADTSEMHGMIRGQQRAAADDYYEKGEHYPITPDEDITSAINYDEMGLAPDPENDLLYGEPGTESFRPEIKEKPLPGEFYEYPDEKWGAPINYNTYRDEDYGAPLSGFRKSPGSFMFPGNLFGFLDKESYGPMPGAELPYEMYEDEEINPDMLDPAYWDQFTPG